LTLVNCPETNYISGRVVTAEVHGCYTSFIVKVCSPISNQNKQKLVLYRYINV